MIITTAGHIDHGKTALVRALTGTDTDRLPEERARGITVDLGFAHRRLPGGTTLGFVDVPGHERLVRTMVAGASGVDLALLVVAADDGVMPQTREHVAILDLLGVRHAVVAITKADRVQPARIDAVRHDIAALLAPAGMAGTAALPCDSLAGTGIPAIAASLERHATAIAARSRQGRFRLAVDRSFLIPGIGLICAGFVHAGQVRIGDRLLVSPGGYELRVRSLHAHDQATDFAVAGQRVAINVAGPRADKATVARGAWLLDPALHRPTTRLDIQLRLLDTETHPLKHWTPVHLHLGTASVTARVGLQTPLAPGHIATAQLVLDAPIAALSGDRFALRDASAQRTIGGGRVLDPFAPARRAPNRTATLAAWSHDDDAAALSALLDATPAGLDLAIFRQARNLAPSETITEAAIQIGPLGIARAHWTTLQADFLAALDHHHAAQPDSWGATADELASAQNTNRALVTSAIRALVEAGDLARTGNLLHRPGREIRLAAHDSVLWEEARTALAEAALDPPRLTFLAERLGADADTLRDLLDKLARLGWLQRVSPAYYLMPDIADQLASAARETAAEHPAQHLTVGKFRERTGIGRHATMPVLEYFDRIGLTRRIAEGRLIITPRP